MNKAEYIKSMKNFKSDARLYELEVPLEGYSHVIVSKIENAPDTGEGETYIFGYDLEDDYVNWSELPGSTKGDYSHEEVLEDAGYTVV